MFIAEGLCRLQRQDPLPRFRRNNDGERLLRVESCAQVARAPQLTAAFISAALLDTVEDGLELPTIEEEAFVWSVQAETEWR